MILIRQKPFSHHCGQCCLAMLGDMTLENAILLIDTSGKTSTKMMREALEKIGYKLGKTTRVRKEDIYKQLPSLALCTIHCNNSLHWIIWDENQFLDSEIGIYRELPDFYKLTSFIELEYRREK